MKKSFGNLPRMKQIIDSGRYAFYLDNSALIPIEHWESVIAPGMSFTMRIRDGTDSSSGNLATEAHAADDLIKSSTTPTPRSTHPALPANPASAGIGVSGQKDSRSIQIIDSEDCVYDITFRLCRTYAVSRCRLSELWVGTD